MWSAITDRIMTWLANQQLRKLPAVRTGGLLIQELWTEHEELVKDLSPEFVKQQAEFMVEEVVKVAVSPDPRMANRAKLMDLACGLARFAVLTIDPPPAENRSGLRGQPGITGALKPRLFELYRVDKGLQELFHGLEETPKNWDDVWGGVSVTYRQFSGWTSVFAGLRYVFDDCNKAPGKDWFRPFFAALCGFQENQYRELLKMPSAFDRTSNISPDLKPLLLGLFLNCVRDGAPYPDLDWNDRIAVIEKGDHSWRANSWLAREKSKGDPPAERSRDT